MVPQIPVQVALSIADRLFVNLAAPRSQIRSETRHETCLFSHIPLPYPDIKANRTTFLTDVFNLLLLKKLTVEDFQVSNVGKNIWNARVDTLYIEPIDYTIVTD